MRGRIFVHKEKCLACHRCRIGCAVAHSKSGELFAAMLENPPPRPRIRVAAVGAHSVPSACRQCEAAACMMVCPTGALSRKHSRDPVVLDKDLCVGCRSCVVVCPYGVPEMNQLRSSVIKCDLCIERLDAGEVPACVASCMPGALEFVSDEKIEDTPEQAIPAFMSRPSFSKEDRS